MQDKTEQLKNCPFCGGKAILRYRQPLSVVQCKKCKAFGRTEADYYEVEDGKQKAIEAWNRRALKLCLCPNCGADMRGEKDE